MAKKKIENVSADIASVETATTNIADAGAMEALHAASILKAAGAPGSNRVVISVPPEDVLVDPRLSALRSWGTGSVQERAIPELARTMLEQGQLEACVCRTNAEGDLVLVLGHRRREAIIHARNEGWKIYAPDDPDGEPSVEPLLDVVVEDMDDARALRAALLENVQREDFTPIEMMRDIGVIRQTFHTEEDPWMGSVGTAKVADFLGVSPATVSQTERLAQAPQSVQDDVQAGRMKMWTALELVGTGTEIKEPDKRAEVQATVLSKAQAMADKREEKRLENERKRQKIAQERVGGKRKAGGKADLAKADVEPEVESKPVAPVKGQVTGKDVRVARRLVDGAEPAKPKAPRMSELTEIAEGWDGPAYPETIRKFVRTLAAWGHGKTTFKKLEAALDDLADALPKEKVTAAMVEKKPVEKVGKVGKPVAKKAPVQKPAKKKK